MNILRFGLAVLALAAASAQAADRAAQTALQPVSVRDHGRLVIDCRDQRLPTMNSIGEVLQSNNAAHIYAERERLVHIAHRECMRGAATVAFVRDAGDRAPALALASTPTP